MWGSVLGLATEVGDCDGLAGAVVFCEETVEGLEGEAPGWGSPPQPDSSMDSSNGTATTAATAFFPGTRRIVAERAALHLTVSPTGEASRARGLSGARDDSENRGERDPPDAIPRVQYAPARRFWLTLSTAPPPREAGRLRCFHEIAPAEAEGSGSSR